MKYKAILLDLDGTLLPMDLKEFQMTSSMLFVEKMEKYGYDKEKLFKANWDGIMAMSANDGSMTNEEAYSNKMCQIYGNSLKKDFWLFREFYANEFDDVKKVCGYNPDANKVVNILKEKEYRLVLATNAWFPPEAIEARLRWAGVDKEAFELITTYDNSCFCKPKVEYYLEILEKIGLKADECLMVGNDVTEDMCAAKVGMDVFLVTDDLVNKENVDISVYPQGDLNELIKFVENP